MSDDTPFASISMDTLNIDLDEIDADNVNIEGHVPKEDLRALIEEWKNNPYDGRTSSVVEMCADELEDLL